MRKLVPSLPFYQKDLIKSKMRIEKNKERGVFASLLLYSPFYAHMASHWENAPPIALTTLPVLHRIFPYKYQFYKCRDTAPED